MHPQAIFDQLATVPTGNALLIAGLVLITYAILHRDSNPTVERWIGGALAIVGLMVAAGLTWLSNATAVAADVPSIDVLRSSVLVADELTRGVSWLTLLGGVFVVLIGWDKVLQGRVAETYACLLFLLAGLVYSAAANDLTTLFLGLELVSIPTTVLLAITRTDDAGREATLKYFTLAAFASGFFLLGCSYLYGIAGSTSLIVIQDSLAWQPTIFTKLGLTIAFMGLCFRVSAVPFHSYAPDVFSGASLSMAAMMSYLPKVAGMVGIMRLLGGPTLLPELADMAVPILLIIAVVTMTVGNCLGLVQTKMRRLLAYSSIAHSGYLLFGVAAIVSSGSSVGPILYYLAAYAVMTLAVFAVLALMEPGRGGTGDDLADFQGLFYRRPWLAACTAIGLLSLTGLPLTTGFWAKLQIFAAGLESPRTDVWVVALILAVNAVISAVYYLSIIYRMVADNPYATPEMAGNVSRPATSTFALGPATACALGTILTVVWFFLP